MAVREQDAAVDRLALEHGRVMVGDGYEDECLRVTLPSLRELRVTPEGVVRDAGVNTSREAVQWACGGSLL